MTRADRVVCLWETQWSEELEETFFLRLVAASRALACQAPADQVVCFLFTGGLLFLRRLHTPSRALGFFQTESSS